MRIVLAGMAIRPEVIAALGAVGGPALVVADDEAGAVAALPEADAFIVSDNAYTPALAQAACAAPRLRWMQIVTAGYDNVTRLGAPAGAVITSVGDAFSPSVAVHGVALMLALMRGVHRMAESKARRQWDKGLPAHLAMPDGKTLAVLGFGSIGQDCARIVAPLGMKVIGLTRSGAPHPLAAEAHRIEALHDVLPRADVLMIAAPLNPGTLGIIGARELAAMKPGAVLVNISRGKLVDTMALDAALRAGRIAGAGLDVTEPEPLPPDHPLWEAPNLIISPHVAGAAGTYGMERQIARLIANLRGWMAGEKLEHVVRP